MFKDKFGKTRQKIGLHIHTTLSDGRKTPDEAARLYREAGFDAIAITDHWQYGEGGRISGLTILSGCEYNTGTMDAASGVYHIVGVLMQKKPFVMRSATPQEIIDAIHDAGGIAILAHPAWSLNTPEKIAKLRNLDGIEIYNTVSDVGKNRRGDSSLIIDMLGVEGKFYPLHAADDTHDFMDELAKSFICVECESLDRASLFAAIKAGKFYASQGPEIHLLRNDDGTFTVNSTEVVEVVFQSNMCSAKRVFLGDALTSVTYTPRDGEKYVRAYVTDKHGRRAWSGCLTV